MDVKVIQKYKNKTISQLLSRATKLFNKFIRERDKDKGCISCGARVEHAGHFYEASQHPELKYNENNVHGQCVKCNYYLGGNQNEYRKKIITRISQEELNELDMIEAYWKRNNFKWSRIGLIDLIEQYKNK